MTFGRTVFIIFFGTSLFLISFTDSNQLADNRLLRALLIKRTINLGNRFDVRFNVGKKFAAGMNEYSWRRPLSYRRRRTSPLYMPNEEIETIENNKSIWMIPTYK